MGDSEIESLIDSDRSVELLNAISDHCCYFENPSTCILCRAVKKCSNNCIRCLLEMEFMCKHSKHDFCYYAASTGNISCLSICQDHGIDIKNSIDGSLEGGQLDSFMWFMMNYYEDSIKHISSHQSLKLAAKGGNSQIFNEVFKNVDSPNLEELIQIASLNGNEEIVDFLLKQPNLQFENSLSLINAIKSNHNQISSKLIKQENFPINISIDGVSPLMAAIDSSNSSVINFLLQRKDLVVTNDAVFLAIRKENVEVLSLIFQVDGIDINCVNEAKETPLHVAASLGNEDIVKFLIKVKGIIFNNTDNKKVLFRFLELHYREQLQQSIQRLLL